MMRTSKVNQGRLRVELLEDRVQPGSLLRDQVGFSVLGDLVASRRQANANIALVQAETQQQEEAAQLSRLSFVSGATPTVITTPATNATPVAVSQDHGAALQSVVNMARPVASNIQLGGGTLQSGSFQNPTIRQVASEAIDPNQVVTEAAPAPITLQPVVEINTMDGSAGVDTVSLNWSSYLGNTGNDAGASVELRGSTLIGAGHFTNPETGVTLAAVVTAPEDTFATAGLLAFGFEGATDTRLNGQVASADGSTVWVTGTTNVPTASGGTVAILASIDLLTPAINWVAGYVSADDATPVTDGCGWVAGDPANNNACGNGIALSPDGSEVSVTGSLVRSGANPGRAMLVARLDAATGAGVNGFTFRFSRGGAAAGDSEGRAIEINSGNEARVTGYFFDNFAAGDDNQLLGGKFNPDSSFAGGLLFLNPGSDKGLGIALNGIEESHVVGYFANDDDPTVNDLAYAVFTPGMDGGLGYGLAVEGGTIDGRAIAFNEAGHAVITGGIADAFVTDMDAYVLRLSSEPAVLDFAPLATEEFPALGMDAGRGIATGPSGAVYITGSTTSSDFLVTPGVAQGVFGGDVDAFAIKLTVAD